MSRADVVRLRGVAVRAGDGFDLVRLDTAAGLVLVRSYPAPGARAAVVLAGGVGGGWDTPARELYPALCAALPPQAIQPVRVRYRNPLALEEAAHDILATATWLTTEGGIERVGFVGHSFGGAVMIQAAARNEHARTVVTLSTQSYGAAAARDVAQRCSLLVVHGRDDEVLPAAASEYVARLAGARAQLVLYDGAGHTLDEVADELRALVEEWLVRELGRPTL